MYQPHVSLEARKICSMRKLRNPPHLFDIYEKLLPPRQTNGENHPQTPKKHLNRDSLACLWLIIPT